MDAISYEYTKQRREFGLHPSFGDSAPKLESVQPNEEDAAQWLTSALTTIELDCIPEQAQHEVNTERFLQSMKGTSHTEGAWPAEIKTAEFVDRQRYLRRIMNEPLYARDVVNLAKTAEGILNANNAIDLYEEYFSGTDHGSENTSTPPSARTLCVFRDPNKIKRTATKISWHPDGANKLAVSYSMTQFQAMPADMPLHSYIWDVNSPNQPDSKLLPTSPLTALVYNPRSPDHLVGGCYNGLVAFWDLRKGCAPVESSILENSHHDPVYDVFWIQSRSGNECCSLSTDGQLLWWDIRKLKKGPTDAMLLNGAGQGADGGDIIYGGTAMEYRSDAGATRFLVGSEQGAVLLADRKAKKDSESSKSIKATFGAQPGQQGHHGPIYAIQRNPFNVKYFMTVGDWTAKIWMEDLKSPLLTTKYDKSYLTSGCWSPTRPGVMFTTKMDGTLDVWDYYHKQNDPTFSTKVSDVGLSSIKVQSAGKLVALGSLDGTVTVLQLSRGLYEPQKEEKGSIAQMFERELRREKNLEMRYIQRKRDEKEREKKAKEEEKRREATAAAQAASATAAEGEDDQETKDALQKAEVDFYMAIDMGGVASSSSSSAVAAPASSSSPDPASPSAFAASSGSDGGGGAQPASAASPSSSPAPSPSDANGFDAEAESKAKAEDEQE